MALFSAMFLPLDNIKNFIAAGFMAIGSYITLRNTNSTAGKYCTISAVKYKSVRLFRTPCFFLPVFVFTALHVKPNHILSITCLTLFHYNHKNRDIQPSKKNLKKLYLF